MVSSSTNVHGNMETSKCKHHTLGGVLSTESERTSIRLADSLVLTFLRAS